MKFLKWFSNTVIVFPFFSFSTFSGFFSVGNWGHHEYSHSGGTWPWENLCPPIHPRTRKTSSRGQKEISHSWARFWLCPVHAFLRICRNNVLWRISSRQKRIGVPKCLQVSYFAQWLKIAQKWLIFNFYDKITFFCTCVNFWNCDFLKCEFLKRWIFENVNLWQGEFLKR